MKLLTTNTKIDKSMAAHPEYMGTILQMLPGKGVCVNYKACIKTCLAFTGFAKIFPSMKTICEVMEKAEGSNLNGMILHINPDPTLLKPIVIENMGNLDEKVTAVLMPLRIQ